MNDCLIRGLLSANTDILSSIQLLVVGKRVGSSRDCYHSTRCDDLSSNVYCQIFFWFIRNFVENLCIRKVVTGRHVLFDIESTVNNLKVVFISFNIASIKQSLTNHFMRLVCCSQCHYLDHDCRSL